MLGAPLPQRDEVLIRGNRARRVEHYRRQPPLEAEMRRRRLVEVRHDGVVSSAPAHGRQRGRGVTGIGQQLRDSQVLVGDAHAVMRRIADQRPPMPPRERERADTCVERPRGLQCTSIEQACALRFPQHRTLDPSAVFREAVERTSTILGIQSPEQCDGGSDTRRVTV